MPATNTQTGLPVTTDAPVVQKHAFIAVMWTIMAICTVGVAFRFFVRFKCFRRLLADDYLVAFGWSLLLACAISYYSQIDGMYEVARVSAGLQYPSANFQTTARRFFNAYGLAMILFYVGLWSIKVSFLVFFYKLGRDIRAYKIFWWCVTVFTVASCAACVGSIPYGCLFGSLQKIYTYCNSNKAIRWQELNIKINCFLDIFTDVLITSMPISLLWSVRISLGRKFLLGGIFSLVIITITISIVRVVAVSKGYVGGKRQAEITWVAFWSFTEFAVATLVACLASFRTFYAHKERKAEAEEAREREIARKGNSNSNSRALWFRAKHFQQSLFESAKTVEESKTIDSGPSSMTISDIGKLIDDSFRTRHSFDLSTSHIASKTESLDSYGGSSRSQG